MKTSKRQLEIEARRAADPIAQALGRTDIDYSTDELPTAPRSVVPSVEPPSQESSTGWQPIETAPKDGTWILVYEHCEPLPSVYVVRWGVPEWWGASVDETWVTIAVGPNPDTYNATDATHWMPLPDPPITNNPKT
jgi:hypothetical protein